MVTAQVLIYDPRVDTFEEMPLAHRWWLGAITVLTGPGGFLCYLIYCEHLRNERLLEEEAILRRAMKGVSEPVIKLRL